MQEIIIHIGLHRTGTTFLQKEVFEKLPINYIFDDAIHRIEIKPGINLISNEGLSLSMPHSKTNRLQVLDHLNKLFPNARIIIGLREKKSWLKSCYSRYMLSGGILEFDVYKYQCKSNVIDFDSYLKEVQKRFSNIYIYHFEDLKKKHRHTIKGICDYIGVDAPDYKMVTRNASLTDRQLRTLSWLNYFFPGKYLRELIKRIRGAPT